jgi:peptidoglycan/xylan/chitin deacetylase (PgdA/CDA1 family)
VTVLAAGLVINGCANIQRQQPTDPSPPAGLTPYEVPLFVVFGSDDNGVPDGMHFLTGLFVDRINPSGTGNPQTFDGMPAHFSFYVNTRFIVPESGPAAYARTVKSNPVEVKLAWQEAIDNGHEIGVHTHSHPHGSSFTVARWQEEIDRCIEILGRPQDPTETAGVPNPDSGMGIPRQQLLGFRTPYLEYNDNTLAAVRAEGLTYDCSLEDGARKSQDVRYLPWPYTLDHGSPSDPNIGSHAGLWEIPAYVFVVPPDEVCAEYGVKAGLRRHLARVQDYFDPAVGKISGMDWNLWMEFDMTPAQFLATIRYTMDLRLQGNRCPFTIGLHSALYADTSETTGLNATVAERRQALQELIDDLLARPQVRLVSAAELLQWLQAPVALSLEESG